MLTLPQEYCTLITTFAPIFSRCIWDHIQILLVGAILAPGKRTVTAALQIMGLSHDRHFQNYHRLLNRAVWSSLAVSRVLLTLLVSTFAASGPLVIGLDDTIERRRGAKIKAKGIYRDPVRSSHSHTVKASGLRWLSLMPHSLGQAGLGLAVSDRLGAVGALLPGSAAGAQETDGLGPPTGVASAAVAAST